MSIVSTNKEHSPENRDIPEWFLQYRIAWDGMAYNREEFRSYYGSQHFRVYWNEALDAKVAGGRGDRHRKKKWLPHCDGIRDSTRPSSKTLRASSPIPALETNLITNMKAVKHIRKDRYLDFTKNTTEVAVDVAPDELEHGLSSSFSIMICKLSLELMRVEFVQLS